MKIDRINHIAYRCRDAKETAEWYRTHLNMDLVFAFASDRESSSNTLEPAMHLFIDAGSGNFLAFVEMSKTPWVDGSGGAPSTLEHIALQVESEDALLQIKTHLEASGLDVEGVTDHTIYKSIYCLDPNGHRIELVADCSTPEQVKWLDSVKWTMLEEWSHTKRNSERPAWMRKPQQASPAIPP